MEEEELRRQVEASLQKRKKFKEVRAFEKVDICYNGIMWVNLGVT